MFRFAHTALTPVTNKDNVYPVLFGGPASLVKMYSSEIGPFAQVVGPKVSGLVDQFKSLGYKWLKKLSHLTKQLVCKISNIGGNLQWQYRGGYALA